MKREYLISLILVVCALSILVFVPRAGWRVGMFLRGSGGENDVSALQAEILFLRTELAKSGGGNGERVRSGVDAFVYSRYPFNFKDRLFVSQGRLDGVEEGSFVVWNGVFLGVVEKVFNAGSEVKTVFDPSFRASVRIGEERTDALLVGGTDPRLTLIPRNKVVKEGDPVYSVSLPGPYGLPVGETGSLFVSSDGLFLEAPLTVPYVMGEITEVVILSGAQVP